MASDTPDFESCRSTSISHFHKTVCLQSWWLVKAEENSLGGRLAVAGFTSREQQAVRLFSSAPIAKRHDVFTLETTDGICVMIKGFIDKARAEENGFPPEVFQHFVWGFPPYWEDYAESCLGLESTRQELTRSNPRPEEAFTQSGTAAAAVIESIQISAVDHRNSSSKITHEGSLKRLEEKNSSKIDKMEKFSSESGERISHVVIWSPNSEVEDGGPDGSSHGFQNSDAPCTHDEVSVMSRNNHPNMSDNVNNTRSSALVEGNHSIKSLTYDSISPTSARRFSKRLKTNMRLHRNLDKQPKSDFILEKDFSDSSQQSGSLLRSSSKLKPVVKLDQASLSSPVGVSDKVLGSLRKLKGVKRYNQVSEKDKDGSICMPMDISDKGDQAIADEDISSADICYLNTSDAGNKYRRKKTTLRKPDMKSSTCSLGENARSSNKTRLMKQVQNHHVIMTKCNTQKGMDRTARASRNSTYSRKKKKIATGREESFLKTTHASGREAKRKLEYENMVTEKADEHIPSVSLECISFKRSRSGRLLMPTLEFWRNQIAIYDVDRKLTGIKKASV